MESNLIKTYNKEEVAFIFKVVSSIRRGNEENNFSSSFCCYSGYSVFIESITCNSGCCIGSICFTTITNIKEYIEIGMIKIGEVLHLKKEPDNAYDIESIIVENKNEIPIGYVANSVNSVAKGTHSAGYIYRSFKDSILCTVKFIYHDMIIAQLQSSDEEGKDMQN